MPDDEDYSEIDTTEAEFDAMWAEAEPEPVHNGMNVLVGFGRRMTVTARTTTGAADPQALKYDSTAAAG